MSCSIQLKTNRNTVVKSKKANNVIHLTTSETIRLGEPEMLNNNPKPVLTAISPPVLKKSTCSFQITGVSLNQRSDLGDDSADDLDESHTDDISRVTDNETPSFSEDTCSRDAEENFIESCSALCTVTVIESGCEFELSNIVPSDTSDICETVDQVVIIEEEFGMTSKTPTTLPVVVTTTQARISASTVVTQDPVACTTKQHIMDVRVTSNLHSKDGVIYTSAHLKTVDPTQIHTVTTHSSTIPTGQSSLQSPQCTASHQPTRMGRFTVSKVKSPTSINVSQPDKSSPSSPVQNISQNQQPQVEVSSPSTNKITEIEQPTQQTPYSPTQNVSQIKQPQPIAPYSQAPMPDSISTSAQSASPVKQIPCSPIIVQTQQPAVQTTPYLQMQTGSHIPATSQEAYLQNVSQPQQPLEYASQNVALSTSTAYVNPAYASQNFSPQNVYSTSTAYTPPLSQTYQTQNVLAANTTYTTPATQNAYSTSSAYIAQNAQNILSTSTTYASPAIQNYPTQSVILPQQPIHSGNLFVQNQPQSYKTPIQTIPQQQSTIPSSSVPYCVPASHIQAQLPPYLTSNQQVFQNQIYSTPLQTLNQQPVIGQIIPQNTSQAYSIHNISQSSSSVGSYSTQPTYNTQTLIQSQANSIGGMYNPNQILNPQVATGLNNYQPPVVYQTQLSNPNFVYPQQNQATAGTNLQRQQSQDTRSITESTIPYSVGQPFLQHQGSVYQPIPYQQPVLIGQNTNSQEMHTIPVLQTSTTTIQLINLSQAVCALAQVAQYGILTNSQNVQPIQHQKVHSNSSTQSENSPTPQTILLPQYQQLLTDSSTQCNESLVNKPECQDSASNTSPVSSKSDTSITLIQTRSKVSLYTMKPSIQGQSVVYTLHPKIINSTNIIHDTKLNLPQYQLAASKSMIQSQAHELPCVATSTSSFYKVVTTKQVHAVVTEQTTHEHDKQNSPRQTESLKADETRHPNKSTSCSEIDPIFLLTQNLDEQLKNSKGVQNENQTKSELTGCETHPHIQGRLVTSESQTLIPDLSHPQHMSTFSGFAIQPVFLCQNSNMSSSIISSSKVSSQHLGEKGVQCPIETVNKSYQVSEDQFDLSTDDDDFESSTTSDFDDSERPNIKEACQILPEKTENTTESKEKDLDSSVPVSTSALSGELVDDPLVLAVTKTLEDACKAILKKPQDSPKTQHDNETKSTSINNDTQSPANESTRTTTHSKTITTTVTTTE